jgi:hypothetical protein
MADLDEVDWYALRGHQFANTAFIGFAIAVAASGFWLTAAGGAAVVLGIAGALYHEQQRSEAES